MRPSFLLAFDSTHDALAAQQALEYLKPRLIPVPRMITAGCGMALLFKAEDEQRARTIYSELLSQDIKSHVYVREGEPPCYRMLVE